MTCLIYINVGVCMYEKVLLRVLMKVRDLKEKIEKYQDVCNKELFVNDMTLIRVNVERMEKRCCMWLRRENNERF